MPLEGTEPGIFKFKALCGMPVIKSNRDVSEWGSDANKGTGHSWCPECDEQVNRTQAK